MSVNPTETPVLRATELRRAVLRLCKVVGLGTAEKPTVVTVAAHETTIRLTATSRVGTMSVTIPGDASGEGSCLLRNLRTASGALTGALGLDLTRGVRFVLDDGDYAVSQHEPVFEPMSPPETTWTAPDWFREAIGRVVHAIAPEDNRYGLSGLCVDRSKEGTVLVATDGNRLAVARTDGPALPKPGDAWEVPPSTPAVPRKTHGLLPRVMAQAIVDSSGPLAFGWNDRVVTCVGDGWRLTMRMADAEFPAWRQVIPASWAWTVTLDRDVFARGLRRVLPVASLRHDCEIVCSVVPGAWRLEAKREEARASVAIPCGVEGAPVPRIGFNARFLLDALTALPPGPVRMSLGTVLGPVKVESLTTSAVWHVVMPVRLD